jgi:hypothetical protein
VPSDLTYNLTFFVKIVYLFTLKQNQPMKVARKYEEGVKLHQAYIDVLLRLAGYRLSDLYTSILAHSSFYGTLDKVVKERIASEFGTSIQVISNGITKLRKMGILEKNAVILDCVLLASKVSHLLWFFQLQINLFLNKKL